MKSKSSFKSTFFTLFILACIGFIAYSVFVYVQDNTDESPSLQTQPEPVEVDETPANESLPGNLSADQQTLEDQQLDQLNEQTANEVKNEIADNGDLVNGFGAPAASLASSSISISFSFMDVDKPLHLNLGVTFARSATFNDSSCKLTVKDATSSVKQQAVIVSSPQASFSGCRFSGVDLSSLSRPTPGASWQLTIGVYDGHENLLLPPLVKDINSLSDLNTTTSN